MIDKMKLYPVWVGLTAVISGGEGPTHSSLVVCGSHYYQVNPVECFEPSSPTMRRRCPPPCPDRSGHLVMAHPQWRLMTTSPRTHRSARTMHRASCLHFLMPAGRGVVASPLAQPGRLLTMIRQQHELEPPGCRGKCMRYVLIISLVRGLSLPQLIDYNMAGFKIK